MSNRRNFDRKTKVAIIKRATRPDGQPACERCGAIGCRLEVHHRAMDAMEVDKSRELTADDGELLCGPCHNPITATQRKHLAKALAREAKSLGATRPTGQIKSRGFAKAEKPDKPPARTTPGMTNIARRFGLREE